MKEARALIVDDEPDIRELISLTLERMDIPCKTAADIGEAKQCLKDQSFELCLTDMRLPDGNGIELVEYIQEHCPQIPVAVITAFGSMELAIQALKAGAFDFVSKPVNLDILRNLVESALQLAPYSEDTDGQAFDALIGKSKAMANLRKMISKLARSQAPVLISGDSGTGKELVARLIHEQGPRAEQAFVPVNCGAIPSELMESEFFGYKKGSFTGATDDHKGLFQAANKGTLFLDEIAELPLAMQVKLLRVIQEKAVRPIGHKQEIPIDVRILSASHKDLTALVADNSFRQDLFYRINVIQLQVPSLQQRPEDIPLLVNYILEKLAMAAKQPVVKLSSDAMQALQHYAFPGNVRELENILERAMTLSEGGELSVDNLQLPEAQLAMETMELDEQHDLGGYLDQVERHAILKVLEQHNWNRTNAAKQLGLTMRALRYRLKKLGIDEKNNDEE